MPGRASLREHPQGLSSSRRVWKVPLLREVPGNLLHAQLRDLTTRA